MFFVQAASVTWIASLPLTPISANTAIYQINPLLVYVFSIFLLHESISHYKLAAVLLAVVGVVVVAVGRESKDAGNFATWDARGYALVTISTIVFSLKEASLHQNLGWG